MSLLCQRCQIEQAIALIDVPVDEELARRIPVCTDCWAHMEDPVVMARPKSAYAILEHKHA